MVGWKILAYGVVWFVNTSPFQTWSNCERFYSEHYPDCTREMMINSIMKSIVGYSDYNEERVEKQRPVLLIPAYIDQRMSAQASCFLLWGKIEKALENMIETENNMALCPTGITYRVANDQRFLANFIVSGESKHNIMRELDLLGVNEKTVFPGLDGIGRYIERYYKENPDDICTFI